MGIPAEISINRSGLNFNNLFYKTIHQLDTGMPSNNLKLDKTGRETNNRRFYRMPK